MYQPDKDLSVSGDGRVPSLFHEFAVAIRCGCLLRPRQCFDTLYEGADAACALGAARVAGYDEYQHAETEHIVDCPMCSGMSETVYDMVAHLNDTHKCTRERIADWLETLEEK